MSAERVLVQRDIYEEFQRMVADRAGRLQAGDTAAAAHLVSKDSHSLVDQSDAARSY